MKEKKNLSIIDIAKKAGVSKSTISLVINNSPLVNKKTKEKVLKIIKKYNYIPNNSARSLKSKQSKMIGVIVSDIKYLFLHLLLSGIEENLFDNDYKILIGNTLEKTERLEKYINDFISLGVDGIILWPVSGGEKENSIIKNIIQRKIPLVLIDRYLKEVNSNYVIIDNYKISYKLTRLFIKQGCKNIAYIGNQNSEILKDRVNGYLDALKDYKIKKKNNLITLCDNVFPLEKYGYDSVKKMISTNKNIDAIICSTDYIAAGVILALQKEKIKIPEDIMVAGFDNLDTSNIVDISITTVDMNRFKMGKTASEILLDIIKNKKIVNNKKITLNGKIIFKESTFKLEERN